MSEKKNIEKLFKDALGKADVPPPKDAKAAIEKKLAESGFLKEDDSRKRMFFWILAIATLILFSTGIFWYVSKENKNDSPLSVQQNSITETNVPGKLNSDTQQYAADSLSETNTTHENIKPTSEKELDGFENINKSNIDNDKNNFSRENFSKAIEKSDEPAKEIISPRENENRSGKNENNPDIRTGKIKPGDNEREDNNAGSKTALVSKKGISPEISSGEITQNSNREKKEDDKTKNENAEILPLLKDSSVNNLSENETTLDKDIASDSSNIQTTDSTAKTESNNNSTPDSLPKAKNKNKFSVDVFVAAQQNQFKFKSSSPDFNALADLSQSSESEKVSLSAGIGINIPFKSFFVEPGIIYSYMKSHFSHFAEQVYDTSGSHYNYVDSLVTDTIVIHIDSSWVTVTDTLITKVPVNASLKISVFEIPLWIGYKFNAGKFDVEIKTGASAAFTTSVDTTQYPYEKNPSLIFIKRENSPYRKTWFSLLAGASVFYNVNERFSVFLQPSFKYGLNSIFKDNYPLSKKVQSYSMGAGLRIKF